MKYILINIKNFIQHETAIFLLVVLCILSSTIIINFSFGFYHHLEQKKLDSSINTKELTISFQDESRSAVTKENLMEVLSQLDEDAYENCVISFEGRFISDRTENAAIDNTLLVVFMPFCIKNGNIEVAPLEKSWTEDNVIKDGNYFTAEQFNNGELVCLAPIEGIVYEGEEAQWAEKYSANEDGTYTVDGKEYTCIGHVDWYSVVPMVPITTVTDNCYIQRVSFSYEDVLTRQNYTDITQLILENYGDLADIPSLDIPEIDSLKFYNTLLVLCILLIVMSGIILSILYEYVLLQRKRQLTIYRICGMTRGKAKLLYFLECFFIAIIIYLFAILFFHFLLLPYLSSTFKYLAASYTLYSYALLGVMYIGITSVILYIMICRQMKHNVVQELREV